MTAPKKEVAMSMLRPMLRPEKEYIRLYRELAAKYSEDAVLCYVAARTYCDTKAALRWFSGKKMSPRMEEILVNILVDARPEDFPIRQKFPQIHAGPKPATPTENRWEKAQRTRLANRRAIIRSNRRAVAEIIRDSLIKKGVVLPSEHDID